MRIIPVLDVKAGLAVHAVGGDRAHYPPLRSPVHGGPDPIDLASSFRDISGLDHLYLADLDAIAGSPPSLGIYRALAELGLTLWVDAGLRDADGVGPLLDARVSTVVAGTETLGGRRALAGLLDAVGDRLMLSVDIRGDRCLVAPGSDWGTTDPVEIARSAGSMGCRRVLLLDLSTVGTGLGPGVSRVAELRRADPSLVISAGGGVRGPGDIEALRRAGASSAVVGTALHSGAITRSGR